MSPPFRVLITDRAWPDCSIERNVLAKVGAEIVEAPNGNEATLIELAKDADAIGTNWASVTSDVIRASDRLRNVTRFGIGLDNICVKTCTELGIPVTNIPDYCVQEVSDHALLGVASFLLSDHRHWTPFELCQTRNQCAVIAKSAVAVQLHKIGKQLRDVVGQIRPLRMARNLRALPWAEVRIELLAKLRHLRA